MDYANLKPTTLSGIKQLAKRLKKRDGIAHAKALEAAAQQAGYPSYQAAHDDLPEQDEYDVLPGSALGDALGGW